VFQQREIGQGRFSGLCRFSIYVGAEKNGFIKICDILLRGVANELENGRGNSILKKNRVNQSTLANTYESGSQNRLSISKN
jgi:hypothetical protein